MVACALGALGVALHVIVIDAPLRFGLLFADFPDPDRPGHLKGVIVSTPELLAKALLAVALLVAATWLWRQMRKPDGLSTA